MRNWGRRRMMAVGILVAGLLVVLFTVRRDPEPISMLLQGEQYLNVAREARADLDAPETFAAASLKVVAAREAMRGQFRRPAFFRDYDDTRRLLGEAHRLIAQSMEESRQSFADRMTELHEEIRLVRSDAEEIRSLLLYLPPKYQAALRHVVTAESRTWAAEAKLTSEETRDALENMRIAHSEIELALQDVRNLLLEYLSRRDSWNRDLQATLTWTEKRGRVAVVIDKLNHKLHIVRQGRSVRSYPVELGPGWLHRKLREGDKATPEGRYEVERKKSNGQTRYHKALLLDYPNEQDIERFERLREIGTLGSGSRIGGLIEIHGDGGKGEDWTLGCVSLENDHIDEIFPMLSVGSPVTIVGLWEEPRWLTRTLETASR